MESFDIAATIALLALGAIQVWLTIKVWKSPSFERSQKVLQSKLIWLLPVVGAVLVFSLMPEDDDLPRPRTHLRG